MQASAMGRRPLTLAEMDRRKKECDQRVAAAFERVDRMKKEHDQRVAAWSRRDESIRRIQRWWRRLNHACETLAMTP